MTRTRSRGSGEKMNRQKPEVTRRESRRRPVQSGAQEQFGGALARGPLWGTVATLAGRPRTGRSPKMAIEGRAKWPRPRPPRRPPLGPGPRRPRPRPRRRASRSH